MKLSAKKIAEFLEGGIVGSPDTCITKPAKIEEADTNSVSFIAHPKYEQYAATTNAGILIVNDTFNYSEDVRATLITVKDAYASFAKLLGLFASDRINTKIGIEERAFIAKTAVIGNQVYVGAFSYISENVRIGNHVKIFPNVFIGENSVIADHTIIYSGVNIYHDTQIGKSCIIHSGAVIGSDGFGFTPLEDGSYDKIPQLGNVILEDKVEVGANTTIDRATMGSTLIQKGVKLDNLITLAHNVELGENTVMAAQSGISGSTKLGKNCVVAGQVGFVGHITIADGSRFAAQCGVTKAIKDSNKAWLGAPADEYSHSIKTLVIYRNLPELEKRVRALENTLTVSKS